MRMVLLFIIVGSLSLLGIGLNRLAKGRTFDEGRVDSLPCYMLNENGEVVDLSDVCGVRSEEELEAAREQFKEDMLAEIERVARENDIPILDESELDTLSNHVPMQ